MKAKYSVKWYEYDLTEMRCRNFFTKIGAMIFASWIENQQGTKPKIYEQR